MALPRVIAATLKAKQARADGNVLLAFAVKLEDDGVGALGYLRIVMNATNAADFTEGTEYTWTATAGD